MVDHREKTAHLLVYSATRGEPFWWALPTDLNDLTKEAIAVAVERGWMLDRGDSISLTDAGRELAQGQSEQVAQR